METTMIPTFETPTLQKRLKSMLGVDFYRLFHTPMFYIFLAIAAIIPAMVSSMAMMGGQNGQAAAQLFTNTWNIIAADSPLYVVRNIGEYANMNMVFIFGGIMVSIFIGHDYRSGYVKQLFTTHAKKSVYMISKSLTCAFAMACMCFTSLLGGLAGGVFAGLSMEVNFGSLLLALLGKLVMSLGWASLYTFMNVILRRQFGVSITACFVLGTGIPVIGAAALLGNTPLLNIFLYGSSVSACLSSNLVTLLTCIAVSALWTVVYNTLGTLVLTRSDVY